MDPYPLKFRPILVPKVWGGRRIGTVLGRSLPADESVLIGESWELADLPEHRSVVANGPLAGQVLAEVIRRFGDRLLGRLPLMEDGGFPLLVKYLDAAEALSVQVHPDAAYAAQHPGVRVKHECWYVLAAEPGTVIYKGIKPGVTPRTFAEHIADGTVVNDLIAVPAKAGECHYLPSGTCHALGAGVLVVEIQTPGDTTFRVYDWGRTSRSLHVEQAMQCIHFGPPNVARHEKRSHIAGVFTTVSRICHCDYFQIEKVRMSEGYGQEIPYDRPAVWAVLEGKGVISGTPAKVDVPFGRGDVMLVPAGMDAARVELAMDTVWLDVQFPPLMSSIELA